MFEYKTYLTTQIRATNGRVVPFSPSFTIPPDTVATVHLIRMHPRFVLASPVRCTPESLMVATRKYVMERERAGKGERFKFHEQRLMAFPFLLISRALFIATR